MIKTNQLHEYIGWKDHCWKQELKSNFKEETDPHAIHAVGEVRYRQRHFSHFMREFLEEQRNKCVAT